MRLRLSIVAGVVLLSACTATTPQINPSGSASTPSASPTRTRVKAVRAVTAAVVYDDTILIYDPATDRHAELATGVGVRGLRWLDRDTLAVVQEGNGVSIVKTIDTSTREVAELDRIDGSLLAFDIADDGSMLAGLVVRGGDPTFEIRYLSGDRAVLRSTTIPQVARGGSVDDQIAVSFSPGGSHVLVVDTAAKASPDRELSPLQIRRLDGSLVYDLSSNRGPTMARWLPDDSLVFRSSDGVRRWQPGQSSSSSVASLSAFYGPWPSPNGRSIAFDTGARNTRVQVRRLDRATGSVTNIGPPGRFRPVYAAGDAIWMQVAQRCTPGCTSPIVGGPEVYAFNPSDGKERLLSLPTLEQIAVFYA